MKALCVFVWVILAMSSAHCATVRELLEQAMDVSMDQAVVVVGRAKVVEDKKLVPFVESMPKLLILRRHLPLVLSIEVTNVLWGAGKVASPIEVRVDNSLYLKPPGTTLAVRMRGEYPIEADINQEHVWFLVPLPDSRQFILRKLMGLLENRVQALIKELLQALEEDAQRFLKGKVAEIIRTATLAVEAGTIQFSLQLLKPIANTLTGQDQLFIVARLGDHQIEVRRLASELLRATGRPASAELLAALATALMRRDMTYKYETVDTINALVLPAVDQEQGETPEQYYVRLGERAIRKSVSARTDERGP